MDESPGHYAGPSNADGGGAMSFTQTTVGGAVILAALQSVWVLVGPSLPPIEVHSLNYDAGYITQDRTVNTSAPWVAVWEADIVDAISGRVVDGCHGEGNWSYEPGRKAVRMTVQEWVGNSDCNLTEGQYFPRAIYASGTEKIVARGEFFEVTE